MIQKMKKVLPLLFGAAVLLTTACVDEYDDTRLQERLSAIESDVASLRATVQQLSKQVSDLKSLIDEKGVVSSVVELKDADGNVTGYSIYFLGKDEPVTISAVNGDTPTIGVKEVNGTYYWTIDGEWLLDGNGDKVIASGKNGENGKDGVTPQLMTVDGYLLISPDGETWTRIPEDTSVAGSLEEDETNVYLTLADGTVISLPKEKTVIRFKDASVKTLCLILWDKDDDYELSYKEAEAVTEIASKPFAYKAILSFTELVCFKNVTTLASGAFRNCKDLLEITLPESLTTIGNRAFSGCSSLETLTLPEKVTTIGTNALDNIVTVYVRSTTPPTLSLFAFGEDDGQENVTKVETIYVPTASVAAYKAASGWSDYSSLIQGYDFD